jgi:MarR family transcriptional regulator for hemolysin
LAKKLSIEAPTLVRMLDTLAKDGLIKRIPDENDKRVVHNELTDEGEKAVEQIKQLTNDLRMELLRGLSLPDIEVTQRVLYQLIMRLDEADED